MTEADWNACTDLDHMLEFLGRRANDRKLQLFGVACCRRVWHLMTDPRHRQAVEAAERFADGLLTEAEFEEALRPVIDLWAELPDATEGGWEPTHYMTGATRHLETGANARFAASYAARGLARLAGRDERPAWHAARLAEGRAQCYLLRDLFGDPSFPFRFDPTWLGGAGSPAVELAREIYREGRFDDLPALADILEHSGYDDRSVLEHCRRPGPHAKGCWVVDALLGQAPGVRTGLLTEKDWRTCVDPQPLLHFLRDKGSSRKWRLFAVACCRRIGHLIADERSRRAVEVAASYADGAATAGELEAARTSAQEAEAEAKQAEYVAEAEANFCITPAYAATCRRLFAASAACSTARPIPQRTEDDTDHDEAGYWQDSMWLAAEAASQDVYANFESVQGDARWEETRRCAESARAAEWGSHCDLLRDLFGEYLGPPGDEGGWLSSGVARRRRGAEQWCLLPKPRSLTIRPEWLTWNAGTIPRMAQTIYGGQTFDGLPLLADALEDAGCTDRDLLDHLRGPGPHARGCFALDLLLGKK